MNNHFFPTCLLSIVGTACEPVLLKFSIDNDVFNSINDHQSDKTNESEKIYEDEEPQNLQTIIN